MADEPEDEELVEVGRSSRMPLFVLSVALVALVGVVAWSLTGRSNSSAPHLPEGVAIVNASDLAPASTTSTGRPVDSIGCVTESHEVTKLHTHTLVLIYDHGVQRRVPAGVGITQPWIVEHFSGGDFTDVGPSDCLYWVHTHAADGIVHVEAPMTARFTLGEFFAIWRQPLSTDQVGPAHGPVTVYINGRHFSGDPRTVPLEDGATIQLDVGSPVVPGSEVNFHVVGGCGQGSLTCSSSSG